MLNLDTHVLLHAVAGRPSAAEKRLLQSDRWSVAAIVLWEIAKLAQLGRIEVNLDDADVVRVLSRIHVWPLTREIALASTRLDVRGDPADELIAATSVVHNVPLLTRDRALRRSRVVPLARSRLDACRPSGLGRSYASGSPEERRQVAASRRAPATVASCAATRSHTSRHLPAGDRPRSGERTRSR